jgi:predicted lipoprotein with Yx(FWY)xxD motif
MTVVLLTLVLLVTGACKNTITSTFTSTSTATITSTSTATLTSTSTSINTLTSTSTATSTTSTSTSISTTTPAYTVNVSTKTGLGSYLVDNKGMTLYYFTKDSTGNSTATGATLTAWPIFNVAAFNVPSSLNAADFGTITRADGLKQSTYKGWPLYYYAKDINAGDTIGENVGGVWFVSKIPFYTVMLQTKTGIGNYLVDAKGMTLYYFANDSVGKSTVSGTVLQNWPVFSITNFIVTSGTSVSDFSNITRTDGLVQTIYKGYPLYYYSGDKASGDTNGQGINNLWYTVTPANFPPTTISTNTTEPVLR